MNERKRSTSEVIELTDMEQDVISHDQAQVSENKHDEKAPINSR